MPGPISDSYEGPTDDFPHEEEDKRQLCYHGLMGHEFVGMHGSAGKRCCRVEANTCASARQAFYPKDVAKAVYQRIGKKTWQLIWKE